MAALQRESGIVFEDGDLPIAHMLEARYFEPSCKLSDVVEYLPMPRTVVSL